MVTVLLIAHGLIAVALLGAVTHQAFSTGRRRPTDGGTGFSARYRSAREGSFTTAIVVLFVMTCIGGVFLYPQYRIDVRPSLEERQLSAANGVFEIKEHLAAIGLGVLPAYWVCWKQPDAGGRGSSARRGLTWILTFVTWWGFLVGHVLNNIKGLLP